MRHRIIRLTAAAVLALALTACQSTASSGSSGGSTSGGSSGGTTGGSVPSALASADVHSVPDPADEGKGPGTRTSDDFDGCSVWFGYSKASASTYLIAADKYGIGGHVTWKCSKMGANIDRLRFTARLEYAFTLGGPYTAEPSSTTSGGGTSPSGSLFPLTDHCTTDWWRVRVTIGWDETLGGPMSRPDLVSEARKVTDADCNRE